MTEATTATRRHLGLALAVIGTAQLMVVLDASIVNVALPSVQKGLHFSGANLEWVVNAYTLAFGGLLLLGGRTGDLFGRRRMFVIGVGLFAFASLLGGLATNAGWLIAARAAQGVGGRSRLLPPCRSSRRRSRKGPSATGPWASTPPCPGPGVPSAFSREAC